MPFNDENAVTNLQSILAAKYTLPDYISDGVCVCVCVCVCCRFLTLFSAEAKDLLSRILVRDPQRRLSLRDIWSHPWTLRNGTPPLSSGQNAGGATKERGLEDYATEQVDPDMQQKCFARLEGERERERVCVCVCVCVCVRACVRR